MADTGVRWMAAPIALPLVGVERRVASGDMGRNDGRTGARVRVVADPKPRLACLVRDHTDDGRTIVRIGPMPFAFIGPSTWQIAGVAMGRALFPPPSDPVHRPQRPCHSWPRSARSRSGGLGGAAARSGAVSVIAPAHVRAVPWAHPWQGRGAAAPAWKVVAASFRTRSPLAACSSHHTCDSDRPERTLARGITGALGWRNADISRHWGAGGVPTRGYRGCRPAVQ